MRWDPWDAATASILIRSYRRVFRWRRYAVLVVRMDPPASPGVSGQEDPQ